MTSSERETGTAFIPRFNPNGLITAVVSEAGTGAPLMVAFMNEETLRLTLETGEAHFFSRSRQKIWHKGSTSGNVLTVEDIRTDCDQDVIWITANLRGHGAACHTGRKSCFYRSLELKNDKISLINTGDEPLFDPAQIYES